MPRVTTGGLLQCEIQFVSLIQRVLFINIQPYIFCKHSIEFVGVKNFDRKFLKLMNRPVRAFMRVTDFLENKSFRAFANQCSQGNDNLFLPNFNRKFKVRSLSRLESPIDEGSIFFIRRSTNNFILDLDENRIGLRLAVDMVLDFEQFQVFSDFTPMAFTELSGKSPALFVGLLNPFNIRFKRLPFD